MSGLYLHIPFCRKRCTYCDFHFSTTFENYRSQLIEALILELFLRKPQVSELIETIYFGGGTPSILMHNELQSIFEAIHQHYHLAPDCEISFEVNPEDISPENLDIWRSVGINRLSIGLQTFSNDDLNWMNRAHQVEDAIAGIALAQQFGFQNISVDLIYGLPGQTLEIWKQHLCAVFELGVQHLSAYCLTIEPKTALNHLVRKKKLQPADDVLQSEQFLLLLEKSKAVGFEQYEISNFALPSYASRHNSAYWRFKPYIGIGPSAHSFDGIQRRWNIANNTAYIKGVGKNEAWFSLEVLSANELRNEQILLGLRTSSGVAISDLKEEFTVKENAQIEEFARLGWLFYSNRSIMLTENGRLYADHIAAELFRTS